MGQKDSYTVMGQKDSYTVMGQKDSNTVMGQKDSNTVMGQRDSNTVMGQKDSNTVTGQKDSNTVTGQKDSNTVTGQKDSNKVMGLKDRNTVLRQRDTHTVVHTCNTVLMYMFYKDVVTMGYYVKQYYYLHNIISTYMKKDPKTKRLLCDRLASQSFLYNWECAELQPRRQIRVERILFFSIFYTFPAPYLFSQY